MLIHLDLENFKIWKETGPMRLAPVTLLLGTNSSGKSTLIQSLLLIRQTITSTDDNQDLNLGNPDVGDTVTMGEFKDLLCHFGSNSKVGIEFRWSATGKKDDSSIFSAKYGRGPKGSAELHSLRIGKEDKSFHVQRQRSGIYRLYLGSERKKHGQGAEFRPQKSFAFSPAALAKLGDSATLIKDIGPQLLEELSRIIYLGPIRQLARRDYVWNGRMPSTIGDDGSRAVDALIASGIAARKSGKSQLEKDKELFKETIFWLNKMGLADNLSIKALGGSSRYQLLLRQENDISNLKDVGVGVSQVLPVIVAALHAKPGHIVIVEEPESHLHPLAESLLAELFVHVSKNRNVQFIVETHSEHLFRRMQTLLAKGVATPQNCAMYFIENEGRGAKLKKLHADEIGRIKNWPDIFFGDSLGETRTQTELAIQRMKKMREKE